MNLCIDFAMYSCCVFSISDVFVSMSPSNVSFDVSSNSFMFVFCPLPASFLAFFHFSNSSCALAGICFACTSSILLISSNLFFSIFDSAFIY